MRWIPTPLLGLGAAGATANARAELETADERALQGALVARRVNRGGTAGDPRTLVAERRAA